MKYGEERCEKISQGINNYISTHPERNKSISTLKTEQHLIAKIERFSSVLDKINLDDIDSHIRKKGQSFLVKVSDVSASFCITKYTSADQALINAKNFLLMLSNNSKDQPKGEWITRSQDSNDDVLYICDEDLFDYTLNKVYE